MTLKRVFAACPFPFPFPPPATTSTSRPRVTADTTCPSWPRKSSRGTTGPGSTARPPSSTSPASWLETRTPTDARSNQVRGVIFLYVPTCIRVLVRLHTFYCFLRLLLMYADFWDTYSSMPLLAHFLSLGGGPADWGPADGLA